MENRNAVLSRNLHLMYQAQKVALICMLLVLVPLLNIVALVVSLGAAIVSLCALVRLKAVHSDYANAFAAVMVAFLCNLFGMGDGMLAAIMGFVGTVAGLFQTYFIIQGTNGLLGEQNCDELAGLGKKVWKITLIATAISLSAELVANIALVLASVMLVVAFVASIFSLVKFMDYLNKSSQFFAAGPELLQEIE